LFLSRTLLTTLPVIFLLVPRRVAAKAGANIGARRFIAKSE